MNKLCQSDKSSNTKQHFNVCATLWKHLFACSRPQMWLNRKDPLLQQKVQRKQFRPIRRWCKSLKYRYTDLKHVAYNRHCTEIYLYGSTIVWNKSSVETVQNYTMIGAVVDNIMVFVCLFVFCCFVLLFVCFLFLALRTRYNLNSWGHVGTCSYNTCFWTGLT